MDKISPTLINLEVEDIATVICEHKNIEFQQVLSATRKREVVRCRQLIHYFAKKMTKLSLKTIGEKTGKDHATVIHSFRDVDNAITPMKNGLVPDYQLLRDVKFLEFKLMKFQINHSMDWANNIPQL